MTPEDARKKIESALFSEAESDFVGLWLLVKWVHEDMPAIEEAARRRIVLSIVHEAVESGRLLIGDFVGTQFVPWEASARDAVRRIEQAWGSLQGDPDIGDVAWLASPVLLG